MTQRLTASPLARAALLGALAIALLVAVSAARANPTMQTIAQDDAQLVFRSPKVRQARLRELKALGVDIIKVRLSWSYIAPQNSRKRKPRHFDATNPAAYHQAQWAPYDDLLLRATALGMRVYMDVGGSAPRWASHGGKVGFWINRPNAGEFGKFMQAAGRRYSGSFRGLPRVSLWSVWNEANLGSWLGPAYKGKVPESPQIYRSLLYAGYGGLARSGHGGDQLLYGELLPYAGSSTGNYKVRPLTFLREMACVDKHFHPYRGRAAKQRGCQHFHALPGTGLAYHPYTLAGGPNVRTRNPDDATIANLDRVTRTLDALGARGRLATRRPEVWITEFGFRSSPPDPYGSPLRRVPGFMGESEWLAFRNPRVVAWDQYPIVDDPTNRHHAFSGFHSGIRFHSGKAKPGVYHEFQGPIYARYRSGNSVEIFGGVRSGHSGTLVTIEVAPAHGGHFTTLGRVLLGFHGYFDHVFGVSGAKHHRYRFVAPGFVSRAATPG